MFSYSAFLIELGAVLGGFIIIGFISFFRQLMSRNAHVYLFFGVV